MTKLRPLPPRKIISILKSNGFVLSRSKGSHQKFKKIVGEEPLIAIVPYHDEVKVGVIKSIIKTSRKPREEFAS